MTNNTSILLPTNISWISRLPFPPVSHTKRKLPYITYTGAGTTAIRGTAMGPLSQNASPHGVNHIAFSMHSSLGAGFLCPTRFACLSPEAAGKRRPSRPCPQGKHFRALPRLLVV